MYVAARSRRRGLRGLGASTPASLWTGISQNSLNPFVFLPQDFNYLVGSFSDNSSVVPSPLNPVSTWKNPFNYLSNEAYGALTQDQINQLKAQAAAQITQAAGGNAALAAQQIQAANSNIDSIVQSYGGVAPGGDNMPLLPAVTPFDIPWWAWAAGAGVAAWAVLR